MPSRLLLVEDEAPVQELLAEYLRGRGFLVATCNDGASARVALHSGSWDLLITDLKLPDAEGVDLVRLANQRKPPLSSVVVSGYASVENAVAALTAGAVEVLLKPFRLREAHGAVERALACAQRLRWTERRLAVADWMESAAATTRPEEVALLFADLQRLIRLHAPESTFEVLADEAGDLPPGWRRLGAGHRCDLADLDPAFAPWVSAAHDAAQRCGL